MTNLNKRLDQLEKQIQPTKEPISWLEFITGEKQPDPEQWRAFLRMRSGQRAEIDPCEAPQNVKAYIDISPDDWDNQQEQTS